MSQKNPQVYYVGHVFSGCYYVRCLLPLIYGGWDGERTSINDIRKNPQQIMAGIQATDIVVHHRPIEKVASDFWKGLKQSGKKVVFDNDDTYVPDSGVPTKMLGDWTDSMLVEFQDTLKYFLGEADLVTCTTEFLAKEYRQYTDKVVVLPNCVDPMDWPEPLRHDNDVVRIGLFGSAVANQDYEQVLPVLKELKDRDDVQIVMFGHPNHDVEDNNKRFYDDDFKVLSQLNPEWHYYVPFSQYFDKLNSLRLDMALIPRHDSYFNRAKSNLKFLEASMLEIPVIAQGFEDGLSPYQVNPEDKNNLLLAFTEEDWRTHINTLIADKKLRREIGKKAREYVEDRYSIQNNISKWEDAYKSLYAN